MSKTVYLKIRQLTKTDKQDVYLSDVAEVYAEKKLLPKIKSIKLATFYRTKKDRICISSMQVISAIQQLATTRPSRTATCSAMLRAKLVFPMPGRPATTISWPGCRPDSFFSIKGKPVATPIRPFLALAALEMSS